MATHRPHIALGRRPFLALLAAGMAGASRVGHAAEAQVQRAELAPALYELAYSPSQKALFVASAGGFGENASPSKLFRLDPHTLAVQAEIALPKKGFGVTLDDASGRLYVGHSVDAAISVIDIASNRVLGTVQVDEKVRGEDGKENYTYFLRELQLDATGQRLYAPGRGMKDSALFALDAKNLKLEKTIAGIGPGATGVAMDDARGRVFVSTLLGRLVTVDAGSLAIARNVESGGAEQPLNLAFDAASNRVLAVDQGLESMPGFQEKMQPGFVSRHPGNRLVALDPETGKLLHEAPTGKGPLTLRLDAARKRLYVTNREGGSLTVLDSASYAAIATVELGGHPNSMALDEASGTLFVSVKNTRAAARGSKESVVRVTL